MHNDGSANDGVYGEVYRTANLGGNYNVRMVAYLKDPATGQILTREWNGGFFLTGPQSMTGIRMACRTSGSGAAT